MRDLNIKSLHDQDCDWIGEHCGNDVVWLQSKPWLELGGDIGTDKLEKGLTKLHTVASKGNGQDRPEADTDTMAVVVEVDGNELAIDIALRSTVATGNRREEKGNELRLGC